MKIGLIILNYHNFLETNKCLTELKNINKSNFILDIVIVDNSVRAKSRQLLKQSNPNITIIENNKNLGFAEGNNVGIRLVLSKGAEAVVLLNNDTIVDKNFLLPLIKTANNNAKIGILSPKIYFYPGKEFHYSRYHKKERGKVIWYAGGIIDWNNVLISHRGVDEVDKGQYEETQETDLATGCCMLIKKEIFNRVGLLDKKYFLYWEDADLCQRAKNAGFKIIYEPKSFLWHKNASSSGGAGGNTSVYYQTRNRALFALKYAPIRSKIAVIKELIKNYQSKNYWVRQATKDFFMARFGQIRQ